MMIHGNHKAMEGVSVKSDSLWLLFIETGHPVFYILFKISEDVGAGKKSA